MIVPDFDTYPIICTLASANVIDGGVEIRWDDGLISRLPDFWLREFSPDHSTFQQTTREQKITLSEIPSKLKASDVTISEDGFLCVRWLPEELDSRYHAGWLRAHLPEAAEPPFELPQRRLWSDDDQFEPGWFDGNAVLNGQHAAVKSWVEAIHVSGIGLLRGLPVDPDIIPTIPEIIGPIRHSNFGKVFEVVNRPDANTNAYTSLALAAHSDLATREYMPGLQFLYCIKNEADGGDSILADGFDIARKLQQESPEFYDVLSNVEIPFGTKDQDSDYRFTAPVLEHDRSGNLSTIRYTYWLRSPMRGSFQTINTFYAAFRRFQEIANDPANQISFRLQPGELMAFDNRRALHGRTAFDPASGERYLRGCYGEREELESCLRMLSRRERQQAVL